MEKTSFRQLVFGLALSFWLLGPAHAGWIAAGSHKAGPPALETVRSDSSGMVIDLDIPGLQITETLRDGMVYHGISVPGGGRLSGIGKPALPFVGRYVAVPQGATASVRVIDSRFEEMTGYNVVPAQAPLPESNTANGRPFEKDRVAYGENGFFPGQVAQLEGPVSIRGCETSLLQLFPVQFNPVSQTLRVYSRITVQVTFDGGGPPLYRPAEALPVPGPGF